MSFKIENINKSKLPVHVAVIMDGNGRWAKKQGRNRIFGHRAGVKTVRRIVEASAEIGIKYLTLFTFSTENWQRPPKEISALMELLIKTIRGELKSLLKNNIRLQIIGDYYRLPEKVKAEIDLAVTSTQNNTGLTLVMAISYSAKWDIVDTTRRISEMVVSGKLNPEDINEELFTQMLSTGKFPFPELLIRTSGEFRLSNFLLWELAYTELYFTNKNWPEFEKEDYYEAIINYQERERRFGKVSEQLN